MSFLDDIFNPGKKQLKRSSRHLKRARFQGGDLTGPGGLSAGFQFDKSGALTGSNLSLGEFAPFLQMLFGASSDAFGRASSGIGDITTKYLTPQAQGFQDIFAAAQGIAAQDPLARGQQVTDLLRQRAAPGSQNLVNTTFDRLFASGGLSNQTTREQVTGDLRRQLSDEDLGFQLAGMNFGEQSVASAFQRALGSAGGVQQTLGFGSDLQQQQLVQAMSLLGGAQGLAQQPLALMQMLAGLQGQRSNAELGIAGGFQNNAKLAESTFMNALNSLSNFGSTSADTLKKLGVV